MRREDLVQKIIDKGVVAIIRIQDSSALLQAAEAIHKGGITAIEVTMTMPDALDALKHLALTCGQDVQMGVGTVLDGAMAQQALDAGAQFIVTPVVRTDVVALAHTHDAPVFPGAFSPTEIYQCFQAGADIIKVFPANVLGVEYLRSLRGPFPSIPLMPTGGVTPENAGEWIRAGACAVGIGSTLLDAKTVENKDWPTLTRRARQVIESIQQARA